MYQNLDLLEITPIDMYMEVKVNFNDLNGLKAILVRNWHFLHADSLILTHCFQQQWVRLTHMSQKVDRTLSCIRDVNNVPTFARQ